MKKDKKIEVPKVSKQSKDLLAEKKEQLKKLFPEAFEEDKLSFEFSDFSIPENDPVHSKSDRELSNAIHDKMQSCGVVIVLAGVYASYSKWIDKEIKIAKSGFDGPKSILGVTPYNTNSISTVVKDAANEIVKWNTDSIVDAIKRLG